MTLQKKKAADLKSLHVSGKPLIAFNIWDAGSAKAVANAGAKAIMTGSWSVAAAHGFGDGEELPLELALENIRRIAASVDLPVSLDFEGGYAEDPEELRQNTERIIDAGAVGINFEDQIVRGEGLYTASEQSGRIAAIRAASDNKRIDLFINARTDVFLKTYPAVHTHDQLEEALARAHAYSEAGASGFFAPGLRDPELIRELCRHSPLPVNIMVLPDTPANRELAELGVARISYGPGPYRHMAAWLEDAAKAAIIGGE